jgi:acetyltransferase EpsM
LKKLIILGGSGIGMIASYIADLTGEFKVQGFLNDVIAVGNSIGKYKKIPIIGRTEDLSKYVKEGYYFFIAYVGMQREQEIFNKINNLGIPEDKFANLIHPQSAIPKDYTKIGKGVMVAPYVQLSPDVEIENNCILLGNSFVGHDTIIRQFAHLASNSVVGANVDIGRACHIGTNSTIREKVKIGDYCLIGSGSVVLNNIEENSIYVGNPARLLRKK